MSFGPAAVEGFVPFRGSQTWYRIVGAGEEPGKLPLLVLHGGPGSSHDYLEPLGGLASTGRRVIFYDQVGGGNSKRPPGPAAWTIPLFLEELAAVRRALGLDRLHLLGHSWGGMLGLEYALTRPAGLASLAVADAPASMVECRAELRRLRAELPPQVRETLRRHEAAGSLGDPDYLAATLVFYQRHVCRLAPWPSCLNRSFAKLARRPEVYQAMYGPNELNVTGTLRDWSVADRLSELRVPTLVLSGRYDEVTPASAGRLQRGVVGAEWVLFEHSSHMPHLEESERFLEVLGRFLRRVETATGGVAVG